MFLSYFALAMIIIVLIALFYTFVFIHDLPYEAAKHRNHPQTEAIHVACWLSLFTLHAIWPLVYIWAVSKPKVEGDSAVRPGSDGELALRLSQLESRLKQLEERVAPAAAKGGQA